MAAAPSRILDLISCRCKINCSTKKCSCKKAVLPCSTLCKTCKGTDCENATPVAPLCRAIDDNTDMDYEETYDLCQEDENE